MSDLSIAYLLAGFALGISVVCFVQYFRAERKAKAEALYPCFTCGRKFTHDDLHLEPHPEHNYDVIVCSNCDHYKVVALPVEPSNPQVGNLPNTERSHLW